MDAERTAPPCVFCHSDHTSVSSVQRSVIVEKTWFIRCETCGRMFDVVGTADALSVDDKQRVAEIAARLKNAMASMPGAVVQFVGRSSADIEFLLALVQRLAGDSAEGGA